ncbi:MAG: hypothetical protein V3V19_11060 [Cocleimonas sp.]
MSDLEKFEISKRTMTCKDQDIGFDHKVHKESYTVLMQSKKKVKITVFWQVVE